MDLKVKGVFEIKSDNERVEIEVINDCDLSYYILSDTTYTANDRISNKLRHIYWFNPQLIKKGDSITLYTKKGVNTNVIKRAGGMHYYFYWNLENTVWNNDGDAAVLFHLRTWKTHKTVSNK